VCAISSRTNAYTERAFATSSRHPDASTRACSITGGVCQSIVIVSST
jgi:hypothetical protein